MKPRNIQSMLSRDSLGSPGSAGRKPSLPHPHHNDDSENMNPDEVNKSLRLTANAISNYSFDQIDRGSNNSGGAASSSDEMNIDEKLAALEVENHMLNAALPPFVRTGSVRQPPVMDDMLYGGRSFSNDESSKDNKGAIQDIISTLQSVKTNSATAERKSSMTALIKIVRNPGSNAALHAQFRALLRVLLENLEDEEGAVRALVFGVLTEMLNQASLQSGFHGFTELVMLKVLQAHKDAEKDVVRAAESCAATMAASLPPDMVVR